MSFLSTAVQQVLEDGAFCAVATITPSGPHVHADGVRLLGRADLGDHLARLGEGARVEARPVRSRAWSDRNELAVTFTGTVEDLRRARPRHVGRGRGRRDLDRARDGRLHAEERPVLRRVRGRRAAGAARVDAAGARVRRHRPRAHRAPRRRGCAGGTWALGRRGRVAHGVPSHHEGHRPAGRAARRDPVGARVLGRGVARDLGCPGTGRPAGAMAGRGAIRSTRRCPGVARARRRGRRHAGRAHDRPAPRSGARATWWARWSRGSARASSPARSGSGSKTAMALAASVHPAADALVAITPARLVWWQGWSSGSANVA